jgi:hypothetical protein
MSTATKKTNGRRPRRANPRANETSRYAARAQQIERANRRRLRRMSLLGD